MLHRFQRGHNIQRRDTVGGRLLYPVRALGVRHSPQLPSIVEILIFGRRVILSAGVRRWDMRSRGMRMGEETNSACIMVAGHDAPICSTRLGKAIDVLDFYTQHNSAINSRLLVERHLYPGANKPMASGRSVEGVPTGIQQFLHVVFLVFSFHLCVHMTARSIVRGLSYSNVSGLQSKN